MKLDSQISAIVTGGASGLGAATARALAGRGVRVAVFDLNTEAGEATAAEIGGSFCHCDVTDEVSVGSALEKARAAHGVERVLVNCAGIAIGKRLVRRDRETKQPIAHESEAFAKVIQINLIGTFRMMSHVASAMVDLEPVTADGTRGVIINTASVAAEDGQVGQSAYAASKGGVASLTLPAARDLARDGVRIAAIMPGLFETPMFAELPEQVRDELGRSVPFPSRLGRPAEYAQLALHICENEMLNGCTLRLDGAIRLSMT